MQDLLRLKQSLKNNSSSGGGGGKNKHSYDETYVECLPGYGDLGHFGEGTGFKSSELYADKQKGGAGGKKKKQKTSEDVKKVTEAMRARHKPPGSP
jgi:hypothetical protein